MTLPPLDPARKAVFRERFPVPIEEWERLTRAAEQAEPNAAAVTRSSVAPRSRITRWRAKLSLTRCSNAGSAG